MIENNKKKDNSEELPAGGLLLESIIESIIDEFINAFKKALNKDEDLLDNARKKAKERVLEAIAGCSENSRCWRKRLRASLDLAEQILDDIASSLEQAESIYDAVLDLKFSLQGPGLVGAGSGLLRGIFEVGLEIDWRLGLPYYPASTVKGAVRSLAEELLGRDNAEKLFGRTGREGHMGLVTFYDAYPIGCDKKAPYPCLILTGGVITPHYYSGGEPVKSEYEAMPNPIPHIVIAPGTVFRVVAGLKCPREDYESIESLINKLLGSKTRCNNNKGSCTCIYQYAIAVGILVIKALGRGFAARSGKGYNVLEPFTGELDKSIQNLRVYIPSSTIFLRKNIGSPRSWGPGSTRRRHSRRTAS